jgi:2-methylcitrate dehydratase PrpD
VTPTTAVSSGTDASVTEDRDPSAVSTPTRALGAFVAGLRFEDLPDTVVHHARRALVDWTAAAVAGASDAGAVRMRAVVADTAPTGPCTIVGTGQRSSAPFAALANSYASHVLDWDDLFNPPTTTIHTGSCVWPAVAALAELRGLSGRAAVTAYVAGFEVGARVALAAGSRHYQSGWHVTGTAGHLAAAAAAASALGLSAEAAAHALGCAATQAAGVREVYGSDTKAIHPGKAAMDGVLSALLAEQGFTSTATAIEGARGMLVAISPEPHPELLVEGLGTLWHTLGNGHKLYPSASLTHPVIDAALALGPDVVTPETVGGVAAIDVFVHPFAAEVTNDPTPTNGAQAKFSTPHCVAVALLRGAARPEQFTVAEAADPAVAALRRLVTLHADAGMNKRGALLRVRMADGRVLEHAVEQNKGTPSMPLRDAELEDKLVGAAAPVLGTERVSALLAACWAVDGLDEFAAALPG